MPEMHCFWRRQSMYHAVVNHACGAPTSRNTKPEHLNNTYSSTKHPLWHSHGFTFPVAIIRYVCLQGEAYRQFVDYVYSHNKYNCRERCGCHSCPHSTAQPRNRRWCWPAPSHGCQIYIYNIYQYNLVMHI